VRYSLAWKKAWLQIRFGDKRPSLALKRYRLYLKLNKTWPWGKYGGEKRNQKKIFFKEKSFVAFRRKIKVWFFDAGPPSNRNGLRKLKKRPSKRK
jgi:hypothetical protein